MVAARQCGTQKLGADRRAIAKNVVEIATTSVDDKWGCRRGLGEADQEAGIVSWLGKQDKELNRKLTRQKKIKLEGRRSILGRMRRCI